ncbi:hypothetical protein [Saccharopolyspora hattusasensis]|uniref:hypothetical protein n=1 Tax=Saccharopolyspora hattusasensis TaxID=1128679 RepID=UPI003D98025F
MPSTDSPGLVAGNARELGKRYRRGWASRTCAGAGAARQEPQLKDIALAYMRTDDMEVVV